MHRYRNALLSTATLCVFASVVVIGCGDDRSGGSSGYGGSSSSLPFASACDQAVQHVQDCGAAVTGQANQNCTGTTECVANCVNDASCAELNGTAGSSNPFLQCVVACGK